MEKPSQHVMERTSVMVTSKGLEARFTGSCLRPSAPAGVLPSVPCFCLLPRNRFLKKRELQEQERKHKVMRVK